MSRLTITLSDARHRALKEACARRNKTIGQLIEEGLDFYGIKMRAAARELVHKEHSRAALVEDRALAAARAETPRSRSTGRTSAPRTRPV